MKFRTNLNTGHIGLLCPLPPPLQGPPYRSIGGICHPGPLYQRVEGTYCFWDRSHWRLSALYLEYLWNILMILGRNVEQDEKACCIQECRLALAFGVSLRSTLFAKAEFSRTRVKIYYVKTYIRCHNSLESIYLFIRHTSSTEYYMSDLV